MKKFFGYFWGVIAHPRNTFDELGRQSSIRPVIMLLVFGLLLTYLNLLLTILFSYDWLGTRTELLDPTYVGFFGRMPVGLENWVPIFFTFLPIHNLLGLVTVSGLGHMLSKLWRGRGTFEASVLTLGFAVGVPGILIGSLNDLLFTVPANLISGHPYWYTAAMNGEFGSMVAAVWNFYVIGIYTIGRDLWCIVLSAIAIRRVQGIPVWAAALIALFGYVLWTYGISASFVR